MNSSDRPIVIGLGELLWDCFADSRRPGGAPANVAFQANQLGCRGVPCSRVGRDSLGDELVEFLARQGLATEWIQRDEAHPTGTVTVDHSEPGSPTYVIHEDVAWDYLEADPSLLELAARAAAVCFGTLAQRLSNSRETIRRVLEATRPECLVVYDVNLRQQWYDRATVEASLARSRVVKLNNDEVTVLAELLATGTTDTEAFAHTVRSRYDVTTVCVTRGEQGALLVEAEKTIDVPGAKAEVADAVGAGDAFTAALISARLRGWPADAQVRFANRVGGLVASRPGAMPALRDELTALAAEFEQ